MNLNELIQNAVDVGACNAVINKLRTYTNFEEAIQDQDAPEWCYWYVRHVIKGRWEEGEKVILKSPQYCFLYALNIIKGRWKEGEPSILTSSEDSYFYSRYVLKERWLEAEPIIFSDSYYKQCYCEHFNIIE